MSDTIYNFLRTLPFVALLFLLTIQELNISWLGFILAVVSGAIASGAGYTIWYIALRNLSNVQAAIL
ncbi:MAG: hypothetical protein KTR16_10660 [Acidiferrobacterales bacterium]|nr:hypothetical protein [Acidiferrobacterales bacterium]